MKRGAELVGGVVANPLAVAKWCECGDLPVYMSLDCDLSRDDLGLRSIEGGLDDGMDTRSGCFLPNKLRRFC